MPSPRSCSPGTRIDLETIDQLCRLFGCGVGDLFEYVADGGKS
ncbi:MAG: helix-turn-helix transcriptional regulator [Pseudomonadota bacterium]